MTPDDVAPVSINAGECRLQSLFHDCSIVYHGRRRILHRAAAGREMGDSLPEEKLFSAIAAISFAGQPYAGHAAAPAIVAVLRKRLAAYGL